MTCTCPLVNVVVIVEVIGPEVMGFPVMVAGRTATSRISTCPLLRVVVLVNMLVTVPENIVVAIVIGVNVEIDVVVVGATGTTSICPLPSVEVMV